MKKVFQLQDMAIKYYRLIICLFAAVTLFMLYGNYLTPSKSVIPKDAIMNRDNPVRKMDDYVTGRKRDGFRPDEATVITQKFSRGIKSVQDLKAILDLNDFLKREFGKRGLDSDRLTSLATMPRFVDKGNELEGDYYINPSILFNSNFDLETWKKWVREDPSVYGKFVSRDFKTAYFYFYAEDDAEEMALGWKIKSALEQKNFGWFHQFIEMDIRPKDKSIGLAGWIIGRWIIRQASVINILAITIGAALFVLPGFYRALGSWSQASVSLIMIFLSIIWARGSVGFLALAGSSVGESPYLLFSYAICILQGVSFSLQKFIAYNEAIKQGEAWKKAKGVDRLISLLAFISIGSFVSLGWSFGVRPIVDMAITSSIGLATLWVFSRYLLPAMHIWLETKEKTIKKIVAWPIFLPLKPIGWMLMKAESWLGAIFVEIPLKGMIRINGFLLAQKNIAVAGTAVVCLITGLTGWAVYEIVWPNHKLLVRSKPLEFIPGTLVYETSKELNREGQLGFDGLNFLIEPKWRRSEGIYDPRFLAMISRIKKGIADFPKEIGAREISTVVDAIERISRQSLHKPLPETEQEAGFAFGQIQNKLKPVIQGVQFFHNGVRLTVTCAADDSNDMARLRDAVISYVRKSFPALKSAFGRAQAYPEVDREIREGKPWNIAGDQVLIFAIFLGWLWLAAWKNKDKRLPGVSPLVGALVMNIPTWFATMCQALVMVYCQIPLDLANAVTSAFSINATSDFSFHLLKAFLESLSEGKNGREAMMEVLSHHSRTIMEDAFLNNRVFLPLYFFSTFIPIQRIGIMMLLMLTLCLIGILILVPPLLVLAVKEKKQKRIYLEREASPAWRRVSK